MNKWGLIKRNVQEIVVEKELKKLVESKKKPVVYCGYEPQGPFHLGHMVTMQKLLDLQDAGFKTKVLLADLHAYLNRKGEREQIKQEVKKWEGAMKAFGLKSEFVLGTDFQFKKNYWEDVMKLSLKTTINRGLRSMQEVARDAETARISQMLYPLMQVEDMKQLGVNVALGGMEQRKIHMLARETLQEVDYEPPVAMHTPLIVSLKGPGEKMSKSKPGTGISVTDSDAKIRKYVRAAFCPEKVVENNPLMQLCKLVVFPKVGKMVFERKKKFGGNIEFKDYESMEKAYKKGDLHPMDLKKGVSKELIKILRPLRKAYSS